MEVNRYVPELIFESSWEVCNKVGGIYTVLSTRAKSLQEAHQNKILFIGPDLGPDQFGFVESKRLKAAWRKHAAEQGLHIRIGTWDIPGKPQVVLVRFDHNYANKNQIFTDVWKWFGVDSLHAYGDYDESCMFAWACGQVIESYLQFFNVPESAKVVAHFNEWTTGFGLFYCRRFLPQVATIFTTHATSIGRSISGNNKPLYDYLAGYRGDQMAVELNMVSKHSVEKMAARLSDCFTTVSEITARECRQLLEKDPDVITPNGFEDRFVPKGKKAVEVRLTARKRLLDVVGALTGKTPDSDVIMLATSGRYEFRNKGLDVFIDALSALKNMRNLNKDVVAFILVPGDVTAPRQEVLSRLESHSDEALPPLYYPWTTHWLNHIEENSVLNRIKTSGFTNKHTERVKVLYVPCYLNGEDGVLNQTYYDLLPGFDLTVFPSYYEPWGYTPLESIAFSVPTITTDLAGFGVWSRNSGDEPGLDDGVAVINRTDHNQHEAATSIAEIISGYASKSVEDRKKIGMKAQRFSMKAHWSEFIESYHQAYDVALKNKVNNL